MRMVVIPIMVVARIIIMRVGMISIIIMGMITRWRLHQRDTKLEVDEFAGTPYEVRVNMNRMPILQKTPNIKLCSGPNGGQSVMHTP